MELVQTWWVGACHEIEAYMTRDDPHDGAKGFIINNRWGGEIRLALGSSPPRWGFLCRFEVLFDFFLFYKCCASPKFGVRAKRNFTSQVHARARRSLLFLSALPDWEIESIILFPSLSSSPSPILPSSPQPNPISAFVYRSSHPDTSYYRIANQSPPPPIGDPSSDPCGQIRPPSQICVGAIGDVYASPLYPVRCGAVAIRVRVLLPSRVGVWFIVVQRLYYKTRF
jgi:hypothetical protein